MKELSLALTFGLLQGYSHAGTIAPLAQSVSTGIELKIMDTLSEESRAKIAARSEMPEELSNIIGDVPYNRLTEGESFQLEIMDKKRASLCTLPEAVKYAAGALENINPRILLANIRPIFISHRDTENIREHLAIDPTTLSFMKKISQAHALGYVYYKIVSYGGYNDRTLLYQRSILGENYPCGRSV